MAESAEKRVALIIGNALYKHADPLKNPANDARAIGAALTRLGFTGTKPKLNLDYNGLRQALQEFGVEADGSHMAVLYFAGHGVEVDGRNFLIPVDAKLERSKSVHFETASLDQALNAVDGARQLRLIILDACRNNPFRARMLRSGGARSIGQGLRSIEPGGNVLVAYAAKHGTFALDGKGGNSPYAEALLGHIEKPGIEIGKLFREVRDDVLTRTGREQEPYTYGSLGKEDVYLKPPLIVPNPETPAAPRTAAPEGGGASVAAASPPSWLRHPLLLASVAGLGAAAVAVVVPKLFEQAPSHCTIENWNARQTSKRLDVLQNFAAACVGGDFGRLAEEELEKRDNAAWDEARKARTEIAYRDYVRDWKNQKVYQGKYVEKAEAALTALSAGEGPATAKAESEAERLAKADDAAFAKARQAGTKAALTAYLKDYPQGRNVAAARAELTRLGFVEVAVGSANEPRWIKAGGGTDDAETFKDCADCPRMVVIPAGEFKMGSPKDEPDRAENEDDKAGDGGEQIRVTIGTFAVGKFEVSFAEWDACVTDKGCKYVPEASWGRGSQPVINVSWNDITNEYLPWLSRKTGKTYRLLSEAEWEYAARAKTIGPFSFEGKITPEKANYDGRYSYDGSPKDGEYRQKTVAVTSFEPNAWGLHQVHGNVWEWTAGCYVDSYKDTPRDGTAAKETSGCPRVVRGGSRDGDPLWLRSAYRFRFVPGSRNGNFGVRLARTLTP